MLEHRDSIRVLGMPERFCHSGSGLPFRILDPFADVVLGQRMSGANEHFDREGPDLFVMTVNERKQGRRQRDVCLSA